MVPKTLILVDLFFLFDDDILNSSSILQTSKKIRFDNSLSKVYLYLRSNFSTDIQPTYNFGPGPCGLEIVIEEKHVKWAGNHMICAQVTNHLLGGAPHIELCHEFCNVLMGTISRTVLALAHRRNTSTKEIIWMVLPSPMLWARIQPKPGLLWNLLRDSIRLSYRKRTPPIYEKKTIYDYSHEKIQPIYKIYLDHF